MNSFRKEKELMSVSEAEILTYMSNLDKEGYSESYSKIALNAIKYIQILLGHSSAKTTEIYTHVAIKVFNQIANPLDS